MSHCETCKHWDSSPEAPKARSWEAGDEGFQGEVVVPGDWGTCERILRYGSSSYGRPPTLDEPTDDPAYLSDGSGYFASLTTRSDFGCTLWAGQEQPTRKEGREGLND